MQGVSADPRLGPRAPRAVPRGGAGAGPSAAKTAKKAAPGSGRAGTKPGSAAAPVSTAAAGGSKPKAAAGASKVAGKAAGGAAAGGKGKGGKAAKPGGRAARAAASAPVEDVAASPRDQHAVPATPLSAHSAADGAVQGMTHSAALTNGFQGRRLPDLAVIPEESGSTSGSAYMGNGSGAGGPHGHEHGPQQSPAAEAAGGSQAGAGEGAAVRASTARTLVAQSQSELPTEGQAVAAGGGGGGGKSGRRSVPRELDAAVFKLGRILGSGSFATVYMARQLDTGSKVVVKRLDRRPATSRGVQSEPDNEVAVLTRAGFHPNLVEFRGWYRDPRDGIMCLVMGYCGGGTLAQLIKNPPWGDAGGGRSPGAGGIADAGFTALSSPAPGGGPSGGDSALPRSSYFSEDLVMFWFVQLLLALNHLHGRKIMHRDLKPDNIFLAAHRRIIKLGDLGVAKQMEGTFELAITCLGTPYYMSPEVLASRPYTYASDIWSLGCVLYEMAARRTAFEAFGLPQLMFKILRVAYEPLPPHFSRPFQQLVNCMLRADPEDRPTTQDLLSQPYVRRHLAHLLDLGSVKAAADSGRPSAMPPMVKPSEARSAVKRLERASAAADRLRSGGSSGSGPGAAARRRRSALVEDAPAAEGDGGADGRPESTGGGHGGKLNSPHGAAPAPGVAASAAAMHLTLGPRGRNVRQWDSGARYEAQRQQQAEMRFRAREFEQRITREQVRQQRRERDPAVRAREAELELLRQELLARRERKQSQAAEQQILEDRLGDQRVALEDELAAFRARPRLGRTQVDPSGWSAAGQATHGGQEGGSQEGDVHVDGAEGEAEADVDDDGWDDIPEELDFEFSGADIGFGSDGEDDEDEDAEASHGYPGTAGATETGEAPAGVGAIMGGAGTTGAAAAAGAGACAAQGCSVADGDVSASAVAAEEEPPRMAAASAAREEVEGVAASAADGDVEGESDEEAEAKALLADMRQELLEQARLDDQAEEERQRARESQPLATQAPTTTSAAEEDESEGDEADDSSGNDDSDDSEEEDEEEDSGDDDDKEEEEEEADEEEEDQDESEEAEGEEEADGSEEEGDDGSEAEDGEDGSDAHSGKGSGDRDSAAEARHSRDVHSAGRAGGEGRGRAGAEQPAAQPAVGAGASTVSAPGQEPQRTSSPQQRPQRQRSGAGAEAMSRSFADLEQQLAAVWAAALGQLAQQLAPKLTEPLRAPTIRLKCTELLLALLWRPGPEEVPRAVPSATAPLMVQQAVPRLRLRGARGHLPRVYR
ncbi:hypothetical protein GPECTOR_4g837 [Gonium pectorale]|uniref:non-specific serine/threonine protein kinase n=1 Tax=Gonium pectorale TaxID=33097 RepID=A0A150GXZ4_GONPE|nr:hypothetical protein GPECTOR_4g837 [Gonium pectorale]|eukprot:KXZ54767.1 hypothetical protein GPECTOR_4g837 [Gonium pectorale]